MARTKRQRQHAPAKAQQAEPPAAAAIDPADIPALITDHETKRAVYIELMDLRGRLPRLTSEALREFQQAARGAEREAKRQDYMAVMARNRTINREVDEARSAFQLAGQRRAIAERDALATPEEPPTR